MNEYNFDGLVGPTHTYTGLAYGNLASTANAGSISNPRQAAKQGLEKMRLLMELGIPQAVLPPQQRPNFKLLHTLGFTGQPLQMLQQAHKSNPALLAAVYSAASMWAANMATVSPSCNTRDGRVHITPANLSYNLHRAQEAEFSHALLQKIFYDTRYFAVHRPLPAYRALGDEGAANHSVLCTEYGMPGLELFVYGQFNLDQRNFTTQYPARQTRLASTSIMQQHILKDNCGHLLQQSEQAINAGAFHNDVVFVANKNVLFYHDQAYVSWHELQKIISKFFAHNCYFICVTKEQISLEHAIETYLFNSQLVSTSANKMLLIAPTECSESNIATSIIEQLIAADNPIQDVKYVHCQQSMRNGGGPACMRLRMILSNQEQASCLQSVFLTKDLYHVLEGWINKHYRETLSAADFLDPTLYLEVQNALDELTQILKLGSIYDFQIT